MAKEVVAAMAVKANHWVFVLVPHQVGNTTAGSGVVAPIKQHNSFGSDTTQEFIGSACGFGLGQEIPLH